MTSRKKTTATPESKKLSADEIRRAIAKINKRIAELESFDLSQLSRRTDPAAEAIRTKINSNLSDIFGDGTNEYQRYYVSDLSSLPLILGREWYPQDFQRGAKEGFARTATHLRGLIETLEERLEDLDEAKSPSALVEPSQSRSAGRRVFVVHGHDNSARLEVVAFLNKLKFEPIVLHDQANSGRTIMEKLERYVSDVDFAVVLLTPDDEGRSKAGVNEVLRPRARQNVVLELGLFYGLLGRGKVCALHKGDLELPSDFQGILYTPIDPAGGWHILLAREMRAAGLDVDMNLVV